MSPTPCHLIFLCHFKEVVQQKRFCVVVALEALYMEMLQDFFHSRCLDSFHTYLCAEYRCYACEMLYQLSFGVIFFYLAYKASVNLDYIERKLFHYISGGGMRTFGRTVQQEELNARQNRFLVAAGVAAALWLALLLW